MLFARPRRSQQAAEAEAEPWQQQRRGRIRIAPTMRWSAPQGRDRPADWLGAQAGLRQGFGRQAHNADYHNLYAYSMRRAPTPT